MKNLDDTIVAISTSLGVGAISIIRVSGDEAINIVQKIFSNKNFINSETHTIHYGFIVDQETKIDEVLVSLMRAPKTFTKEDVVEIHCHGGIATTNKVLELLLDNGCRLALPGEFTKRAFLNGRIDLIEAEAVMDLINSKTDESRNLSINQLTGTTSKLIKNLRKKIVEVLANIEVNIDYPEYTDNEIVTKDNITNLNQLLKEKLTEILENSKNTKIIKEGISLALLGRPNVGKSSLLNLLLEENKAIVTDIEGTTRDIVEGTINLDGILLNLYDTAGIRNTNDVVEKIGVEKSLELIEKTDLIIYILNNNEEITKEDLEIISKLKNYIIVINKIDLDSKIDLNKLDKSKIVQISALNNIGIKELKNKIKEIFNLGEVKTKDLTYLSNASNISKIKSCLKETKEIEDSLNKDVPLDMIEINIKNIWNELGSIIGETYDEELIDQLFSQFCLGK